MTTSAARFSAILVLALTGLPACRSKPARRPNVVIVTLDTTRSDRLGAYGANKARTPVFDRLAREGTLFLQASSPSPLTTPAHASLLTGLYPPAHGVRNNGYRLAQEAETLAEVFARTGYKTGAFVGGFTVAHDTGLAQGFELFDDDFGLRPNGRPRDERTAEAVNERALPWLRKQLQRPDGAPFLAWIHYFDAHQPYTPPEPFASEFRGNEYQGEIAYVDAQLGHIVALLEDHSALADTIIIVTADHGEDLGDHGEGTHGMFVYESTIHIPLLVRMGNARARDSQGTPVSLVDVFPSVLELAGLKPRDGLHGQALPGIGRSGARQEDSADRRLYSESLLGYEEFGWAPLFALRSGREKWIEAPSPERYDLTNDSDEKRNLAGRDPQTDTRLKERLTEFQRELEASGRAPGGNQMDEEARERLRSLGYLASSGTADPGPANATGRRNPMAAISDYQQYLKAEWLVETAPGQSQEALDLLEDLLKRDPANPLARLRFVQTLSRAGNSEHTLIAFQRLIADHPDFNYSYVLYSDVLIKLGRHEEDHKLWLEFRARGLQHLESDVRLARAQLRTNAPAQALETCETGLQRTGPDALLLTTAGQALVRLQRPDEAIARFTAALELRPTLREAFDPAMDLLLAKRDLTGAQALLARCIELAPGDTALRALAEKFGMRNTAP